MSGSLDTTEFGKSIDRMLEYIENGHEDERYTLMWKDGSADAIFDTSFEDENEDSSDEYYSFLMRIISTTGRVPEDVIMGNLYMVNKHVEQFKLLNSKDDEIK